MIIRNAKDTDVEGLVDLIMLFYAEGLNVSGLRFDRESLRSTVKTVIDKHIFIVAENENGLQGCIAALFANSIFDHSQKIVEEKIWFIKREYRGSGAAIKLFKALEVTAKTIGAEVIIMAHMTSIMPDKVKKIYNSFGYKHAESHYIKLIGG